MLGNLSIRLVPKLIMHCLFRVLYLGVIIIKCCVLYNELQLN